MSDTFDPRDMLELYENGLEGFVYDEQKNNEFLASLPIPFFSQVNTLFGDGKGKLVLPWKAAAKFHPNFGGDEAQVTGDCLLIGTKVLMENSYEKNIEDINVGEYVITHNNRSRRVESLVKKIPSNNIMNDIYIQKYNINICMTDDHKVLVYTNNGYEWINAQDLLLGDLLVISNSIDNNKLNDFTQEICSIGLLAPITSINKFEYSDFVYCINVEEDHSFIANKIVVHNCVSHGNRNALDITRCTEILEKGEKEIYVARGATEGIYGCRGHGGQGMFGHQAAEFLVKEGGLLVRQKYADLNIDLSVYNANIGINWGSRGIPANVIAEAKKHQVKTASLVTAVEESRDLIANGYGIAVCSNYGFGSSRDKFGIAEARGTWHHCYLADTVISSPDRNKSIKDYKIGEKVFDHNGDIQFVTNTFIREYNGELIKISSYGIPAFKVTSEHPILVYREIENETEASEENFINNIIVVKKHKKKTQTRIKKWIKAKDVKLGDWLLTPKLKYNHKPFENLDYGKINPQSLNIPKQINAPDDDIAWMFGFYIGDGNTTSNHKVSFTFSSGEKYIVDKLITAFDKLGLEITFKDFGTYTRAHCYSSILSRCFDKWFGKYSTDRQIPEFLITQGWNMEAVIEGIYNADGFISGNNKKISMSNKGLILQIRHLLINDDKHPSMHLQKRYGSAYPNGSDCYAISISDRTRHLTSVHEEYYCNPIRKIESSIEKCTVYNLEVSNTHTYIADGVVSHNCMSFIGVDDTRERSNEILFLVQNSWGSDWISGPLFEQPPGSFWIREKIAAAMLAQKQTYVFSDFNGFRKKVAWRIKEIYS